MGRCRSTPGLVESVGKIRIEDMVVGMTTSSAFHTAAIFDDQTTNDNPSSSFNERRSTSSSNNTQYGDLAGGIPLEPMNPHLDSNRVPRRFSTGPLVGTNGLNHRLPPPGKAAADIKPTSSFLSLHSGSTITRPVSPYQNDVSPFLLDNQTNLFPFPGVNRRSETQESLLEEIRKLRTKVLDLEAENASMSLKLSQSKWEMQNRITDLELQMCNNPLAMVGAPIVVPRPTSSGSNSGEDLERNRESII